MKALHSNARCIADKFLAHLFCWPNDLHLKILIFTLGDTSSASCSFCIPGTYSGRGQSSCSICNTGTYSSKTGATSSAECAIVLKIFQVLVPYLLEEITENIKNRIALAVSNVLGIPGSNIVLTFSSYKAFRRQQAKVLMIVGIIDFQGSASNYASKITQENLNIEMWALGLKSGQLLMITGMFKTDVNLMNLNLLKSQQ
jgi:hypothetical protein